jgi:hypothetical protein
MDEYYKFCLNEIRFHTEKINEIIEEGLADPKKYYLQSTSQWKIICQMIPYMYYLSKHNESLDPDSPKEENLSGMPPKDQ